MKQCKQLEKFYTEYICDLIDEEQAARIEEHLEGCAACAREVQSLQNTLRLAEEAEEISIPPVILDNIEMNVYKRLATESPPPQRSPFFAKCVAALSVVQCEAPSCLDLAQRTGNPCARDWYFDCYGFD